MNLLRTMPGWRARVYAQAGRLCASALPWRGVVFCLFAAAALPLFGQDAEAPRGVVGDTLWETIQLGGPVMYVILGFSVLGVAFISESIWRSRLSVILPPSVADQLASRPGVAALPGIVGKPGSSAVARIVTEGLVWRNGTHEQIQSSIEETVDHILWELKRAAKPIGIIANTAPLLGLLGTVIGIIRAFDSVAKKGALGDMNALAGGISEALLTTCFGLIVAIPMLLAYHYIIGRMETSLRHCEELAKRNLILPPKDADRADTK